MRIHGYLPCACIVLALVVPFPTGVAWADDDTFSRATLKGVDSVRVAVAELQADAERDGLQHTQIQADLESRLRQAGIKVDASSLYALGVYLDTRRSDSGVYAYAVLVTFEQPVRLVRDPSIVHGFAVTWSVGSVGMESAAQLRNVRSTVNRLVEQFIKAYLEQNPKK